VIHLAAVAGSHEDEVGFCSYCGRLDDEDRRVCSECGLGVRLRTDATVLRSPGSSFLVVRGDGVISAASAAANRLLGYTVGRPLGTVLTHPDLLRAVVQAAASHPAPVSLALEGTTATVAPCGFPPAALVVLERR
jgi:hypothetical protein